MLLCPAVDRVVVGAKIRFVSLTKCKQNGSKVVSVCVWYVLQISRVLERSRLLSIEHDGTEVLIGNIDRDQVGGRR